MKKKFEVKNIQKLKEQQQKNGKTKSQKLRKKRKNGEKKIAPKFRNIKNRVKN